MCQLSFTGNISNIRKTIVKDKTVFDILIEGQTVYFHIVSKDKKLTELLDRAEVSDGIFAKGEVRSKTITVNARVSERFYMKPQIISINGIDSYQTLSNAEIDEQARKQRANSVIRLRAIASQIALQKQKENSTSVGNNGKEDDRLKKKVSLLNRSLENK